MTKEQKQIRKLVFDSLDKLITICKTTEKQWGNAVPLNFIQTAIGKMKLKNTANPKLKTFYHNYNKVLSGIYTSCEAHIKYKNTNNIPTSYLEKLVKTIKENFDKGLGK